MNNFIKVLVLSELNMYNTNMKSEQYYYNEKAVYKLSSYVLWTVKYKRQLLKDNAAVRLKEMITETCRQEGIGILEMNIHPSYVLLHIEYNPTLSLDSIVRDIKRYTAPRLRREFAALRSKLPAMWSLYYFAANESPTEEEITEYMATQPTSQRNENDERMVSMYQEDHNRIIAAYAERINDFYKNRKDKQNDNTENKQ